jgi:hypothetical protein
MVPLLFSICATAQSVAALQALEQAAGLVIDPAHVRARELLLLVETSREHLMRLLLNGSAGLLVPADLDAATLSLLGQMRHAWLQALYPQGDGLRPGAGQLAPDRAGLRRLLQGLEQVLQRLLGLSPGDWLQLRSLADVQAWMGAGSAPAQSLCRQLEQLGLAGLGASPLAPLPPLPDDLLLELLQAEDAAEFVRAPLWQGQPRETGALQRQLGRPLQTALLQLYGSGLLSRHLARLAELAEALGRMTELVNEIGPASPCPQPLRPSGQGLAQVEAARGRLVHGLRLERGLIVDYRILAPTEWNFHPQGVLAQGLMGLPADLRLPQLAQMLVDALDPCVQAQVSVLDA